MFRLHGGPRLGGRRPRRAGASLGAALERAARQLLQPAVAPAARLGLRRPRLVLLRAAIGVTPMCGLQSDTGGEAWEPTHCAGGGANDKIELRSTRAAARTTCVRPHNSRCHASKPGCMRSTNCNTLFEVMKETGHHHMQQDEGVPQTCMAAGDG